eukprot:219589_1
MTISQKSLSFFTVFLVVTHATTIYVSKNGTDSQECGHNLQKSCGTMYAATLQNVYEDENEIYVHDGQNVDEINKYFGPNITSQIWHPCLPRPNMVTVITFNDQYIHRMNDWFNKGACYDNNNHQTTYHNKYLFDGVVIFNNLFVDNYDTDQMQFSILNTVNSGTMSLVCNNCIFIFFSFLT